LEPVGAQTVVRPVMATVSLNRRALSMVTSNANGLRTGFSPVLGGCAKPPVRGSKVTWLTEELQGRILTESALRSWTVRISCVMAALVQRAPGKALQSQLGEVSESARE
jgi:hypothetical protein